MRLIVFCSGSQLAQINPTLWFTPVLFDDGRLCSTVVQPFLVLMRALLATCLDESRVHWVDALARFDSREDSVVSFAVDLLV